MLCVFSSVDVYDTPFHNTAKIFIHNEYSVKPDHVYQYLSSYLQVLLTKQTMPCKVLVYSQIA